VADQSDTSPPEPAPQPKRRRRALVWSLIVVASLLLIVSITANWVQRAVLNTDEVVNTSDEILKDKMFRRSSASSWSISSTPTSMSRVR
jgi:hypothetical protein